MYTMYLQPLGELTLHLDTMHVKGALIHVTAQDQHHNAINIALSKLICPDDSPYGFGYCRVASYEYGDLVIHCDELKLLN